MKTLRSFIQPAWHRWRTRNECHCCGSPAVKKCKTHSTKLCGQAYCRLEHRRMKACVSGDLSNPFCQSVLLNTWFDYVLYTAVVFVAAVAVVLPFVLLGVI